MSQNELSTTIKELRELRRMADEIAAEIETLTDSVKQHMDAQQVDTLTGADWKITYKAAQYTRQTTTRRFTVA